MQPSWPFLSSLFPWPKLIFEKIRFLSSMKNILNLHHNLKHWFNILISFLDLFWNKCIAFLITQRKFILKSYSSVHFKPKKPICIISCRLQLKTLLEGITRVVNCFWKWSLNNRFFVSFSNHFKNFKIMIVFKIIGKRNKKR